MLAIQIVETLQRDTLGPLTILSGEDSGQYQILKSILFKKLEFDQSDLSMAYFDLSETSYETAELELLSLPFFANEKIVIFDYFMDLSTDKKRYLSDEQLKQFEEYLLAPNETSKLILLIPGKLDSKRRLVKLLKRDGLIIEATEIKEAELRRYFQKELVKIGLHMEEAAFEHLLGKSNADFAELTQNIALLQSYKPSGEILLSDIEQAIPKTLQDNLFDVSQLLVAKKVDQVRELVKDLRLQGEDEIKLIAILITQFRMWLQVRMLQEEGYSEGQIVEQLSVYLNRKVNPFQVKFALRDARILSISFLKVTLTLLIETDYHIKTGQMDKEYLFDICLLKIMNIKQ